MFRGRLRRPRRIHIGKLCLDAINYKTDREITGENQIDVTGWRLRFLKDQCK